MEETETVPTWSTFLTDFNSIGISLNISLHTSLLITYMHTFVYLLYGF